MVSNEFFRDDYVGIRELILGNGDRLLMPMCFLQPFAFERAGERHFALAAAADGANIPANRGTIPARLANAADGARHVFSIGTDADKPVYQGRRGARS